MSDCVSFELRISDKEKRNDRLSDDESMKACLEKIDWMTALSGRTLFILNHKCHNRYRLECFNSPRFNNHQSFQYS